MSKRLIRFLISGVSAAAVEYAVFVALQWQSGGDRLFTSQSLSFASGFMVSYLLNRRWAFQSDGAWSAELSKYAAIATINLIAGNAAIGGLVGLLEVNQYVAKFLVMAMVAAWNYLIFSKLVFKQRPGAA